MAKNSENEKRRQQEVLKQWKKDDPTIDNYKLCSQCKGLGTVRGETCDNCFGEGTVAK